jgi:hypothetical protein
VYGWKCVTPPFKDLGVYWDEQDHSVLNYLRTIISEYGDVQC